MKQYAAHVRLLALVLALLMVLAVCPLAAFTEAFYSDWFQVETTASPIEINEEVAEVSAQLYLDGEALPEDALLLRGEALQAELCFRYLEDQAPTAERTSYTYALPEGMVAEDSDWADMAGGQYRIQAGQLELVYDGDAEAYPETSTARIDFIVDGSADALILAGQRYALVSRPMRAAESEAQQAVHFSDLSQLIYTIDISKNNELQDESKPIIIRNGDTFDVRLTFTETPEKQFRDDNNENMYIKLPDGFIVPTDFETTIDVSVNVGSEIKTVHGNPIHYDHETHRLIMNWNLADPDFQYLADSSDASIYMDLRGTFNVDKATELDFGSGHSITVGPPNNPKVSKSGSYDKDNHVITYDVVVTAEGPVSKPITVTDNLQGVALIYQKDVQQTAIRGQENQTLRTEGVEITTNDDSGFVISIDSMTDGEQLHFTYTAQVDLEQLEVSGETKEETRNTVVIANRDNDFNDPTDDVATTTHKIEFADIKKEGKKSAQYDGEDGIRYQDITWTIETNTEAAAKFAGSTITDTLEYDPANVTIGKKGEGITIIVTDMVEKDGKMVRQAIETREVPWSELNVTETTVHLNPDDPNSPERKLLQWVYNIPSTDESYSYEVTYVTQANISNMKTSDTVTNTALSKGGGDEANIMIGPTGDRNVNITKKVVSSNEKTITWEIEATAFAEGHNSYVITEILPMKWLPASGSNTPIPYKDEFQSLKVIEGLYEGEKITYDVIKRDTYNADRVIITFYKSETDQGLYPKNTYPDDKTDRTIKLQLVTENNQEWVDRSTQLLGTNNWYALHENRAEVRADNAYNFDTARTAVSRLSIRKEQDKVAYSAEVIGGVSYPVYRFVLYVSGVTDDALNENKELVITDVPALENPAYWTVYEHPNPDDWRNVRGYVYEEAYYPNVSLGARYVGNAPSSESDKLVGGTMSYSRAENGTITFTMGNLPKRMTTDADGNTVESYWPFHDVIYFLIPKDEAALTKIRELAMADSKTNGKLTLTNTATVKDKSAKLDYEYSYRPMGKKLSSFGRNKATYEITLNSERMQLNGGQPLTMTDTFSPNLSVDYSSIQVTAHGKGRAEDVSWDYRGNTGTFVIPDETAVTITYQATVTGEPGQDVSFWNTVGFANFTETLNETKKMSATSGGSAGVYQLRLFKYADAHMEGGLAGATFRLLDANKNPVQYMRGGKQGQEVTFTTGEDGYATVTLSQNRDGLAIRKNTVYYLEEIEAPHVDHTYYHKDSTYYSFVISDNPNYNAGGVWIYSNGDILKVRNYEDKGGLYLSKRFAGNVTLTEAQQNAITFTLQLKNGDNWNDVHKYTYDQFTDGSIHIDSNELNAGTYRVVESNANINGYELTTEYQVDGETTASAEFTIEPDDTGSHSVMFTNRYVDHKYTIQKKDSQSGALLPGAEFNVYKNGEADSTIKTYTSNEEGLIEIQQEGIYQEGVLYYAVETKAPAGYILPQNPEKLYFYFGAKPKLPEGVTAADLTHSYGSAVVENEGDKTDIPVAKTWGNEESDVWPEDVQSVLIGLYEQVGDGQATAVQRDSKNWTITLDAGHPYDFATFKELPAVTEGGQYITYSVRELSVTKSDGTVIADPSTLYEISGGTKTNTGYYILNNAPHKKEITVQKEWYEKKLDGSVERIPAPESSHFTLYATTQALMPDENNTTEFRINRDNTPTYSGPPVGHPGGRYLIQVTGSTLAKYIDHWPISWQEGAAGNWTWHDKQIRLIPIPGYTDRAYFIVPFGAHNITFNNYSGHELSLTVSSVAGTMLTADSANSLADLSVESDTFTLNPGGTYTRDDLPATDSKGHEYQYFVVEGGAASDTVYHFVDNSIQVYNYTNETEKTSIVVTKEWLDENGEPLNSAPQNKTSFSLYRSTMKPKSSLGTSAEPLKLTLENRSSDNMALTGLRNGAQLEVYPGDTLHIDLITEYEIPKDEVKKTTYLTDKNIPYYRFNFVAYQDEQNDPHVLARSTAPWFSVNTETVVEYTFKEDDHFTKLLFASYLSGLTANAYIIRGASSIYRRSDMVDLLSKSDLVKAQISLDASNQWTYDSNSSGDVLEKYDADGNPYYYFAVEDGIHGFVDTYAITESGIKIINTKTDNAPESITLDIPVTKILNGRDMAANEFSFKLMPIDPEGKTTETGAMTISNPAGQAGKAVIFHFSLTYTEEMLHQTPYHDRQGNPVFFYLVKEVVGDVPSIAYSNQQYIAKVTIDKATKQATATYFLYDGTGALPAEATAGLVISIPS